MCVQLKSKNNTQICANISSDWINFNTQIKEELRVLIVHPRMSLYGGAELVVVKLANYLTKQGIENAVLTLEISPELEKELSGTEIIVSKRSLRFPRVPFSVTLPLVVLTMAKLIHSNLRRFDVVNVHNFPAELAVFMRPRKVVWMCNEPPEVYFVSEKILVKLIGKVVTSVDKLFVRKFIHKAVVADEFNASRFERIYGFRPVIIPYGIDHEFFSKGNAARGRKWLKLEKEDFVILQVGMITPMKNQLESIKTVEKLRPKIPNIRLVLAGEDSGEYAERLKKYVEAHGLEQHVIFTGHISREIIRDLYASCQVCIFPVRPQGGWLSPFEALCLAKPIIVSREMTASKIIEENGIGVVTDNFASAVEDVYLRRERYSEMVLKGREWVKNNLGWDRFCERMLQVFEEED